MFLEEKFKFYLLIFDDQARAAEILPSHFVFSKEEMQSSKREAVQQKGQEHRLWTL